MRSLWLLGSALLTAVGAGTTTVVNTLTSADGAAFVLAHNNLRRRHVNTPDVSWDPTVAGNIQSWLTATNCRYEHTSKSTNPAPVNISGLGENLYMAWGSAPSNLDPAGSVQAWYDEIANYVYATPNSPNPAGAVVGHFTQVVWTDSVRVACGSCTNTTVSGTSTNYVRVVMCRYGPAGNFWNAGEFATKDAAYTAHIMPLIATACPAVNPCQNGGRCVDGVAPASFTCSCAGGYTGTVCDVPPPPSPTPPAGTPTGTPDWQTNILSLWSATHTVTWSAAFANAANGWCTGSLVWPAGATGASGFSSAGSTALTLSTLFAGRYPNLGPVVGCAYCASASSMKCVYGTASSLTDAPRQIHEFVLHQSDDPTTDPSKTRAPVVIAMAGVVTVFAAVAVVVRRRRAAAEDYSLLAI